MIYIYIIIFVFCLFLYNFIIIIIIEVSFYLDFIFNYIIFMSVLVVALCMCVHVCACVCVVGGVEWQLPWLFIKQMTMKLLLVVQSVKVLWESVFQVLVLYLIIIIDQFLWSYSLVNFQTKIFFEWRMHFYFYSA